MTIQQKQNLLLGHNKLFNAGIENTEKRVAFARTVLLSDEMALDFMIDSI